MRRRRKKKETVGKEDARQMNVSLWPSRKKAQVESGTHPSGLLG